MGLFNVTGQGWQGMEPTTTIRAPLQAKHIPFPTPVPYTFSAHTVCAYPQTTDSRGVGGVRLAYSNLLAYFNFSHSPAFEGGCVGVVFRSTYISMVRDIGEFN